MKFKRMFMLIFMFFMLMFTVSCTIETYSVMFYVDYDYHSSVKVKVNDFVKAEEIPEVPERAYHTFSWYYEDAKTDVVSLPVTKNMHIYGYYEEVESTCTIYFDTQGAEEIEPIVELSGSVVEEPETPQLPGFIFLGWYYDKNFENEVTWPITLESNIQLFAKWQVEPPQTYVVKFFGPDLTFLGEVTCEYGETISRPYDLEEIENYVFVDWYFDDRYEDVFDFDSIITENTNIYGEFIIDSDVDVKVKFYGQGLTLLEVIEIPVGTKVSRPTHLEAHPTMNFVAWYKNSTFSSVFDFDTIINTNTNLYGYWEQPKGDHYPYEGNYYNSIDFDNFTSQEKNELVALLKVQGDRSYSSSNWTPCRVSTTDPNNSSNIILIYNSASVPASSQNSSWNKEHVWPQSLMDSSIAGDQQNLFPCNPSINSSRRNKTFVDSEGTHGSVGGRYYPGDDWRGEVARTLMYMALRYSDKGLNISTLIDIRTALKWHEADPVTKWEMDRNNILFTGNHHKNRNPFVDHPELAYILYGTATLSNEENNILDEYLLSFNYNYMLVNANYISM